jgi:hypothetical protein
MTPPVDGFPSSSIQFEEKALRSVHHRRLTCPSVKAFAPRRLQRLTCHTSARFRVRALGLVSGQLYEATSGGAGLPPSLSCCFSATGIRFLGILFPPRNWALLTVGLPIHPMMHRTRTGFPHTARMRPGWGRASSVSRRRRCSHGREASTTIACRFSTASLCHPGITARPGMCSNETSTRIHSHSPVQPSRHL